MDADDTKKKRGDDSAESSKDSNEEEEGSSSEADEMAAALEAELIDFMWQGHQNKWLSRKQQHLGHLSKWYLKGFFCLFWNLWSRDVQAIDRCNELNVLAV